jgi:hypothetical protein
MKDILTIKIYNPMVWTHVFLAVPLGLGIISGQYGFIALLVMLLISSAVYHITEKPFWQGVDRLFAVAFGLVSVIIFAEYMSTLAMVGIMTGLMGLFAFYLSIEAEDAHEEARATTLHAWWHVYGSVMAFIAVLLMM